MNCKLQAASDHSQTIPEAIWSNVIMWVVPTTAIAWGPPLYSINGNWGRISFDISVGILNVSLLWAPLVLTYLSS
jgi:hypothetical protein